MYHSKKILICATVNIHFICFHLPIIKKLNQCSWQVDLVSNGKNVFNEIRNKFNIPFSRTPLSFLNLIAFFNLILILNKNKYDIIHCHTPVASFIVRIARLLSYNFNTPIIYTAHGFHFYKGAPIFNWIIFYPIEYLLSFITNTIITINSEDYNISLRFKSSQKYLLKGIGIDLDRFKPLPKSQRESLRKTLQINEDNFAIICSAEFNNNKNQVFIINSLSKIVKKFNKIKIYFAGEGNNLETCKTLASKLGVKDNFIFLGQVTNIETIIPAFDLAISASKREGLPVNILESMACGLPIVASNNRGHRELIKINKNGYLFNLNDERLMQSGILDLYHNRQKLKNFSVASLAEVKKYSLQKVWRQLSKIYSSYCKRHQ